MLIFAEHSSNKFRLPLIANMTETNTLLTVYWLKFCALICKKCVSAISYLKLNNRGPFERTSWAKFKEVGG